MYGNAAYPAQLFPVVEHFLEKIMENFPPRFPLTAQHLRKCTPTAPPTPFFAK
jgi:hypothetical protein